MSKIGLTAFQEPDSPGWLEVKLSLEIEEVDVLIRPGLLDELAGEEMAVTGLEIEVPVEAVVRHQIHLRTDVF